MRHAVRTRSLSLNTFRFAVTISEVRSARLRIEDTCFLPFLWSHHPVGCMKKNARSLNTNHLPFFMAMSMKCRSSGNSTSVKVAVRPAAVKGTSV